MNTTEESHPIDLLSIQIDEYDRYSFFSIYFVVLSLRYPSGAILLSFFCYQLSPSLTIFTIFFVVPWAVGGMLVLQADVRIEGPFMLNPLKK